MLFLLFFCLLFFLVWGFSKFGFFDFYLERCNLAAREALALIDSVSTLCLAMLFFCGVAALYFCIHYFSHNSSSGHLLCYMLISFLSVMSVLVVRYRLLFSLVMWEYLGVVSFFLILFYSNRDRLRATLVTIFASRFGDVCFFGLIFF